MSRHWIYILVFGFIGCPGKGLAQFALADIFSSNMVLQRDQPIKLWGKGLPGRNVRVEFGNKIQQTMVQVDSTWMLTLPGQKANPIPQSVQVTCGDEKVVLNDLLMGDVWVCIGQSNMQWPMQQEMHFSNEKLHSKQPILRFYNPVYAGENIYNQPFKEADLMRMNPASFYSGHWQVSDSTTFRTMSAVAYYFGKKVIEHAAVPVGLIDLSIGGAPLEAFISRDALRNSNAFAAKASGNWLLNDALPVWVRERGHQNLAGLKDVSADALGPNHPFKPGFAFESGIVPMLNFAVKGVLCYQGESNAQEQARVKEYKDLFRLMVNDYRQRWHNPSLPFYWVQLSSIDTVQYKGQLWPEFRDEQRKMLGEITFSGMAVSSDAGSINDVHPTNKKVVGERLAAWALHDVYGQKKTIPSGPLAHRVVQKRNKIIIHFKYAGKGLRTSDGQPLRGFSLNGKKDAEAIIKRRSVQIPLQTRAEVLYYGWKPFTDANLVNPAQLPASTFRWNLQN